MDSKALIKELSEACKEAQKYLVDIEEDQKHDRVKTYNIDGIFSVLDKAIRKAEQYDEA